MTEAERRARDRKRKELQDALVQELGKAAVSSTILDALGRRDLIAGYVDGITLLEDVLDATKFLLEDKQNILDQEGARARPPVRGEPVEVELNEREREFTAALSAYLARHATSLSKVREYREQKLGSENKRLEYKEVKDFLRHELITQGEEQGMVLSLSFEELIALACGSPGAVASFDETIFPNPTEGFVLFFQDEGLNLGDLSSWLAALYPWSAKDAALFVLTGKPPEVVALALSYHRTRRVFTLSFTPWISENTFRRVYRRARDIAHERENRQPSKVTLAVLRFVSENTPPAEKPKWTELKKRWNDMHPEKGFKSVSAFRLAYLRAEYVAKGWIT